MHIKYTIFMKSQNGLQVDDIYSIPKLVILQHNQVNTVLCLAHRINVHLVSEISHCWGWQPHHQVMKSDRAM